MGEKQFVTPGGSGVSRLLLGRRRDGQGAGLDTHIQVVGDGLPHHGALPLMVSLHWSVFNVLQEIIQHPSCPHLLPDGQAFLQTDPVQREAKHNTT